jgi:hypothetical protein
MRHGLWAISIGAYGLLIAAATLSVPRGQQADQTTLSKGTKHTEEMGGTRGKKPLVEWNEQGRKLKPEVRARLETAIDRVARNTVIVADRNGNLEREVGIAELKRHESATRRTICANISNLCIECDHTIYCSKSSGLAELLKR